MNKAWRKPQSHKNGRAVEKKFIITIRFFFSNIFLFVPCIVVFNEPSGGKALKCGEECKQRNADNLNFLLFQLFSTLFETVSFDHNELSSANVFNLVLSEKICLLGKC